jgi:chromosome segregation ATPase
MPVDGISAITIAMIVIVILAFIVLKQNKFANRNSSAYPAFFTTIGIFGTFLGISVGLWNFNPNNVQKSLPALLEGLRTAFWISLLGILLAIFFKGKDIWNNSQKNDDSLPNQVTIKDLAIALERIHKALAGQEDSTLLSQMKLLRQDTNDQFGKLRDSQELFMKNMSDRGTDALITALEEVIRDFDTKINQQVGESFHQLNEALGKVLLWQESYQDQMKQIAAQQVSSSNLMKSLSEGFDSLSKTSMDTQAVITTLSNVLSEINTQRRAMEDSLSSLGSLLLKASDALPNIETKILEFSNQMTNGVQASTRMLSESIEASTKRTESQVAALDKALEAELTRAIGGLGQQLTALSQKFVEDYTPLTDKLRDLVLTLGNGAR